MDIDYKLDNNYFTELVQSKNYIFFNDDTKKQIRDKTNNLLQSNQIVGIGISKTDAIFATANKINVPSLVCLIRKKRGMENADVIIIIRIINNLIN